MTGKLKVILSILMTAFLAVVSYILLHELGHALVAVLCGARIDRFSILNAYVTSSGGSFTPVTESLRHAAGMLLPVFIVITGLCFYRKNMNSVVYHLFFVFFAIASIGSTLIWIIFPVMSLFVSIPAGEDAAKFLKSSGLPPLLVALGSAVIIFTTVFFACQKSLPQKFIGILKSVPVSGEKSALLSRKTVLSLAAAVGIFAAIAFSFEIPLMMTKQVIEITQKGEIPAADFEETHGFGVKNDKIYTFTIRLEAAGFLTVIRILDETQNVIYQNIGESIFSEGTIELQEGDYYIHVIHLATADSFEEYNKDINDTFDEETLEGLKAVYEKEKSPPKLFLTIK